ncbi:hypothetical protein [Synechocystis sp. LKSZ1]|uniref:hypothetical protein n=1 Tax=Synechocystis sp. LKSZ1 TaxID=3144951 RepID=UPI00336BCCB2
MLENLIYYPGFEVNSENWLKFALLYLDKLVPIIPSSGDQHLNEIYHKLMNETDLINPHRPEKNEGHYATLDALDNVERILQHPDRYKLTFGKKDFVDNWKQKDTQNYTLFQEKYTDCWENFCLQNKLGHRDNHGIVVHRDLALIYMTILSQAISDKRGISPITDHDSMDRFSIFTRFQSPHEAEIIQTAQGVIELALPVDLSEISFQAIIQHRNGEDFRKMQKAFHQELEAFIKSSENKAESNFRPSLGNIWVDFRDEILKLGAGSVYFGLGVWLLLDSQNATVLQDIRQSAAGLTLAVGSTIAIKSTWKNIKSKRFTRKFLSNLKKLQPFNPHE